MAFKKFLRQFIPMKYVTGIKSYSQYGEDIIVYNIFKIRKIDKPSYIDIGANHPYTLNNTALLYEKGARGINVDANHFMIELFEKHRKKDLNLCVGVGPERSNLTFYIMNDPTLSSFSKEESAKYVHAGYSIVEERQVDVVTLEEIVQKHAGGVFPDFFNLDCEGLDEDIIRSMDFSKSSPKVICIEASEFSTRGTGTKRTELLNYIISKGYTEYANTYLNAILIRNDFF